MKDASLYQQARSHLAYLRLAAAACGPVFECHPVPLRVDRN